MASDLVTPFVRQHTLINRELSLVDGELQAPSGPGLGVELDRVALSKFAVCKEVFR
jgi:L-alanine-DL-glutamate epimerase-like enolase superfamily enzyme